MAAVGYTAHMHTEQREKPDFFDVIILGAGASGLSCSIAAAARGKSVLLIDHAAKPGRKMLIAGGGKCNLTNKNVSTEDYAGENPLFCRSALSRFTPETFLVELEQARVALEEREEGQIFCARSAKDLVNYFVRQSNELGCRFAMEEKIRSVAPLPFILEHGSEKANAASSTGFGVTTDKGRYCAPSLVIATGGPAYSSVGATGIGYTLARQFGHEVARIRPALTGLILPAGSALTKLSGLSLRVNLSLYGNASPIRQVSRNLPLLFTHKGLSGPTALQASLFWQTGMRLQINFMPEQSLEELLQSPGAGKSLVLNLLKKRLPDRLAEVIVPKGLAQKKSAELSREQRKELHATLHEHHLAPVGVEGFARAEVTAGGVSTAQVSSRTMESALQEGLFFCGEVLDVTGRLGGYNLHWAFASGKAAGEHV